MKAAATLRRIATAMWCASGLAAFAQAPLIEQAPSDASRCLTPAPADRHAVEYPFTPFKNGEKGRVLAELRFLDPAKPPEVKILESEGGDEFVHAVTRQLAVWRVPCLASGQSVTLRQEYVFRPDHRKVFWSRTIDNDDGERGKAQACMKHLSGQGAPAYPFAARRDGIQGRVIAELKFDSADAAPSVKIHARPEARALARTIEAWAKDYRVPCLKPGVGLNTVITYVFRFEGELAYGLRNVDLRQLLPLVAGIQDQTLSMDTSRMGCPFDIRFVYRRPAMPNAVGSVGNEDPARSVLLDWLTGIELKLPAKDLDAIYGDTATITVPCLKIDLNPKEKS